MMYRYRRFMMSRLRNFDEQDCDVLLFTAALALAAVVTGIVVEIFN